MRHYGFYVNGQFVQSSTRRAIYSPLNNETLAEVASLEEKNEIFDAALDGAAETFHQIQRGFFPLPERLEFLKKFRDRLANQSEAFIHNLVHEVGKPLALARAEHSRALRTLDWTILEAAQFFRTEGLPPAYFAELDGAWAYADRVPRGPLLAIAPFNFPLNLSLHKIAPALAVGCPVIFKPSAKATLMGLSIADAAHAAGLPPGMLSMLPATDALTLDMCRDPRIAQISFTGSQKVGWDLAAQVTKPICLELGGHAPVFVDESANLDTAADAVLKGAFSYAGQVCISVQNVFVHPKVFPRFREKLVAGLQQFPWGQAQDPEVLSSVVINNAAAERLQQAEEALVRGGARALSAGTGSLRAAGTETYGPRLLAPKFFEDVAKDSPLLHEEIFAPWASLGTLENLDAFIDKTNAFTSRLQAAVFTQDLSAAQRAAQGLQFGGVLVNESPAYRMEPMPYGGHGRAGLGREGPRFAMESFCELRSVIIRH